MKISAVIKAALKEPVKKGFYHFSTDEIKEKTLNDLNTALKIFGDIEVLEKDKNGWAKKIPQEKITQLMLDKYTNSQWDEIEKLPDFDDYRPCVITKSNDDWLLSAVYNSLYLTCYINSDLVD